MALVSIGIPLLLHNSHRIGPTNNDYSQMVPLNRDIKQLVLGSPTSRIPLKTRVQKDQTGCFQSHPLQPWEPP